MQVTVQTKDGPTYIQVTDEERRRPIRRTRSNVRTLKRLNGLAAVRVTDNSDGQIQTFFVVLPMGGVDVYRTIHGQSRAAFWKRFPKLADADVWEEVE